MTDPRIEPVARALTTTGWGGWQPPEPWTSKTDLAVKVLAHADDVDPVRSAARSLVAYMDALVPGPGKTLPPQERMLVTALEGLSALNDLRATLTDV